MDWTRARIRQMQTGWRAMRKAQEDAAAKPQAAAAPATESPAPSGADAASGQKEQGATAAPADGEAGHAGGVEVSQPEDSAEKEADAVADHVADGLHGGEAKEGDAAGQEKAPEIGAKLEGVGRKIHLAEDPSVRNAAVKRLGNAGHNKQQIKDSLKKIAHERAAAIVELTQLKATLDSLGVPRPRAEQAKDRIQAALNALHQHLSDADITGAMRDTVGDPVRQPGAGKQFDHLSEVKDALGALQTTRTNLARLRGELARRQFDPTILSEKLDPALSALTAVVQSVGQALEKMKP
jgi:hypothetical protein